jgi:hypothetical protein
MYALDRLRIHRFRGLRDLGLTDLGRINPTSLQSASHSVAVYGAIGDAQLVKAVQRTLRGYPRTGISVLKPKLVIPAHAGIQRFCGPVSFWIPAFAGMTQDRAEVPG